MLKLDLTRLCEIVALKVSLKDLEKIATLSGEIFKHLSVR